MSFFTRLISGLLLVFIPTFVQALVIDFEDLVTYHPGTNYPIDSGGPIENGYHDFNWRGQHSGDLQYGSLEWFAYMPGTDYVYSYGPEFNMISTGTYFNFSGIDIGSYFYNLQEVVVQGWRDYDLLYETTILVPEVFSSDAFVFDYSGIDRLAIFATESGTLSDPLAPPMHYLSFDNIDYETATPVPEPSTALLLGSGIVGLVCSRRKRKQK